MYVYMYTTYTCIPLHFSNVPGIMSTIFKPIIHTLVTSIHVDGKHKGKTTAGTHKQDKKKVGRKD